MGGMLHRKRSVHQCVYGCCKERLANRTLRKREKAEWRGDAGASLLEPN